MANDYENALILQGIGGTLSSLSNLVSGISAYKVGKAKAKALSAQQELNNIALKQQLSYQLAAASQETSEVKKQGLKAAGSQLAAMAASGTSVAGGSAQGLLRSTGIAVGEHISGINANLANTAYEETRANTEQNINLGYEAQIAKSEGRQALASGVTAASLGLLNTGATVATKWNLYKMQYGLEAGTSTAAVNAWFPPMKAYQQGYNSNNNSMSQWYNILMNGAI